MPKGGRCRNMGYGNGQLEADTGSGQVVRGSLINLIGIIGFADVQFPHLILQR
jgi:hypothetical protein